MKILLLGKDGQLGRELQRSLASLGQLVAWGRLACDLSQTDSLYKKVITEAPNLIVNAAAYTAVDQAESEPDLAHAINAQALNRLAQATRDMALQSGGCKLIHYSTDYVFNGSGAKPWLEDAPTAPLNVYGKTKLAGEQAITASGCAYLIFRTSWVYAKEGGNFAKTMLRLAAERDTLSVIDDQIGAPTDAAWLADVTAHIILRQAQDEREQAAQDAREQAAQVGRGQTAQVEPRQTAQVERGKAVRTELVEVPSGIYHAVSSGEVSWHGYASYLIAKARQMGFPIKVAPQAIRAVPSEAFPTPAQRPRNSRLDCTKLTRTFGITPPPWQQGLDQLLQHLKP
ncbi:MAG: dTDP-4-dehydrorhamnose reductase [Cytophagales bacterium]|nr:dTDP-4-dehydrorhamnose reductase [Cytophagales bacterium]